MNNNNFSSFLTAESLIGMLVIFKLVILIAVPQLALCRGRNRWVSIAEICERLLSSPTAMLVCFKWARSFTDSMMSLQKL